VTRGDIFHRVIPIQRIMSQLHKLIIRLPMVCWDATKPCHFLVQPRFEGFAGRCLPHPDLTLGQRHFLSKGDDFFGMAKAAGLAVTIVRRVFWK
jgi:hypothetical protein